MKRILSTTLAVALGTAAGMAQNVVDAVRYGSTEISGTARYRSMAGAFGALGGDPSSMSDNPAGLAIYRSTNVFTITPHLSVNGTSSNSTNPMSNSDNSFSVSNLSAIFSFKTPSNDNLVNFTLGLGFERKYENRSRMNGWTNSRSTFANYLTNQANAYIDYRDSEEKNIPHFPSKEFDWDNDKSEAPYLSMMAWNSFAIDAYDNAKKVFDPIAQYASQGNGRLSWEQGLYVKEDTRMDHYNISGALNFNDIFYLGATIKLTDYSSIIHTEFDENYYIDYPDGSYEDAYLAYDNDFETKGDGIGFNFGILWAPIDGLRIGAAIHTPEWMTMKRFSTAGMTTDDSRINPEEPWSESWTEWKHEFKTPWEYQLSAAYIIGMRGLISVEYDIRDFTSMRYSPFGNEPTDFYISSANDAIETHLNAQHTLKIGGEYRINKQFSVRAGYATVTSPFSDKALNAEVSNNEVEALYSSSTKPNFNTIDSQYYATCGLGWSKKKWYVDLAFMYHHTDLKHAAYAGDYAPCDIFSVDQNKKTFDLTVGYRF